MTAPDAPPRDPGSPSDPTGDPTAAAAGRAGRREAAGRADPEPSLARRFGQIGVLGWMIAGPAVGGAALGAWLDGLLGSGITLAAALTMLGAGLGLWFALKWMHRQ